LGKIEQEEKQKEGTFSALSSAEETVFLTFLYFSEELGPLSG
jgi:hypothetical protein